MKRLQLSLLVALPLGIALYFFPNRLSGCALVTRGPAPVEIAQESALIIWDAASKTEHFIRRASFDTRAYDFGFLVPTPTKPALAEASDEAFRFLDDLTAPRRPTPRIFGASDSFGIRKALPRPAVRVLETARVARYDVAVLEADDPAALNNWLKKNGYLSSPALATWLKPYVDRGWKITAFKIAKEGANSSQVATAAIRMTFQTDRPFFPYREPEHQSQGGGHLLRVYFLGESRVKGTLGKDGPWPGSVVFADRLLEGNARRLAEWVKLPEVSSRGPWWLTKLEDRSSPRPGNEDLFFSRSEDQSVVYPWSFRRVRPWVRLRPQPSIPRTSATNLPLLVWFADPPFDRYVDLGRIANGVAAADSTQLTDVALQVAEGERILLRSRKGISAGELLGKAAELAGSQHDKEALARLRKEAEHRGDKSLLSRIAAQEKLAAAPRAVEPALMVDVEHTRPEAVAQLQDYLHTLKLARLLGDRRLLDGLAESLPQADLLTWQQRGYLKKQIDETRSALPETPSAAGRSLRELLLGPDRHEEATKESAKLSAASRDFRPEGSPAPRGRVYTFVGQEDMAGEGGVRRNRPLAFQLEPGGRAWRVNADGVREEGTWSAHGPQYQLIFTYGHLVYSGTRRGNTLSGTGTLLDGRWTSTWNWSVQPQARTAKAAAPQVQPAPSAPAPEGR
jgi:hypothetical protein